MSESECGSEVARLRRQIDLEIEAAQRGMSGYAMTAQHSFIDARLRCAWEHKEALVAEVGEDEATKILVDAYIQIVG
jgi:hypothetical protein